MNAVEKLSVMNQLRFKIDFVKRKVYENFSFFVAYLCVFTGYLGVCRCN